MAAIKLVENILADKIIQIRNISGVVDTLKDRVHSSCFTLSHCEVSSKLTEMDIAMGALVQEVGLVMTKTADYLEKVKTEFIQTDELLNQTIKG